MKTLMVNYVDYLIAIGVAGLGGIARLVTQKGKKFSLCGMIAELLVAGFAGVLVNALLMEFKVDSNLKVVIVAISGYTSREVIAMVKQVALSAIRLLLKQNVPVEKEEEPKEPSKEEGGQNE